MKITDYNIMIRGNLHIAGDRQEDDASIIVALQGVNINIPVKQLYNDYFDLLTTFLQTRGAGKDDAADLFQETVLVFIDMVKMGKIDSKTPVKPYLFGIAKNLWLEEIRSRERRNKRQKNFQLSQPDTIRVDTRLFNKELTETWQKLIHSLDSICGKILYGFYYERLSMRDLLEKVSFASEQALRNRKSKCMKSLKEMIGKNPDLADKLKQEDIYGQ